MKQKSVKTSQRRWSALAVTPALALAVMALAPAAQAASRPGRVPKAIVKVAPPAQLAVVGVHCHGVSRR